MASVHVAPALGAASLTDTNFGLTLWTFVLFVLFAFVLTKFGWKPLLAMIEEREKGIRDAVAGAEKARADAQALLARHEEMIREAGRQREEVIKSALAEAERLKADLAEKARTESAAMISRAQQQIEREKTLAIRELRAQVADLAVEAASRIVQSSLTPEAQKKLVHEFIDSLPQARS
jgi:F-type H+-transporting ATPase subunit b